MRSDRFGWAVAVLAAAPVLACGSSQSKTAGSGGTAPSFGGAAGTVLIGEPSGGFGGSPSGPAGAFSIGAGGATGPCHKTAEACGNSLDCCEGYTCNNTAQAPSLNGCQLRCTQNQDCSTGCCLLYTGDAKGICAETKWCGCGMSGTRCGSDQPKCCGDHVCLAADAQQTSYECKKRCTTNADCPTNCCVAIPNLNASACLDPMYCPAPMP